MKSLFYVGACTLLLGACSPLEIPAPAAKSGPRITESTTSGTFRPSKYQRTEVMETPQFGPWRVRADCAIQADAVDFSITTDGRVLDNMMRLTLTFRPNLVAPPRVQVRGWRQPLPLDGRGVQYALELPYTPQSAADMLGTDTYLSISYQPTFSRVPLESTLPTNELMYALAELGNRCQ